MILANGFTFFYMFLSPFTYLSTLSDQVRLLTAETSDPFLFILYTVYLQWVFPPLLTLHFCYNICDFFEVFFSFYFNNAILFVLSLS
jgi:hypothetical protein